jgi:hypothetical protein
MDRPSRVSPMKSRRFAALTSKIYHRGVKFQYRHTNHLQHETVAKDNSSAGKLFDRSVELIKLLAIIAAGLWTIYLYVSDQKRRDDLTLEQAKLQNTKFELDNELSIKKKQIRESGSFDLTVSLNSIDTDERKPIRRVDFSYDFDNKGEIPLTVEKVIIEWYSGSLRPSSGRVPIVLQNAPPVSVLEDPNSSGPIQWTKVSTVACRYEGADESGIGMGVYEFQQGGCGTDIYEPGYGSKNRTEALIIKKGVDFIGASIFVEYGEKYRFKSTAILMKGRT